MDAICHSDQAVFIVPNHCNYPCANFFIFNERSQCYFQNHPELLDTYLKIPKKFIVVSNTSQSSFRESFNQHTETEPDIMFLSAKQYGKSSIAGDIMTVPEARSAVQTFISHCSSIH